MLIGCGVMNSTIVVLIVFISLFLFICACGMLKNIFDSVVLKRFIAGIETDIDKNNADFNSDGNIGISDLIQLNKFLIKY